LRGGKGGDKRGKGILFVIPRLRDGSGGERKKEK